MKTKYFLMLLFWVVIAGLSCSKEKYVGPIDTDSAPDPVVSATAQPLPGGASITYKLPNDPRLRYVKAVYTINGQERETIASEFTNTLSVLGFPDTLEHEIKLYSVSKGEQVTNSPVTVKVKPLLPPIMEAFNSLQVKETFGGVKFTFQNSSRAALAVMVITPDNSGKMNVRETYYMNSENGSYSARGFESTKRPFGFVVRDRWGNLSDTLKGDFIPVFEQQIPKTKFAIVNLPTDTNAPHLVLGNNYTLDKTWDGKTGDSPTLPIFHTAPGGTLPKWFTFDMGVLVNLSRFKLFHRQPGNTHAYQTGDPKYFEVWGSATAPAADGSWAGWTKLMDCHSYKPSGETNPNVTDEDINFACIRGEDYEFPEGTPAARYLRIKIIETWGSVSYYFIDEMTFWGEMK